MLLKDWISLFRIEQYVKNIFLFVPAFFGFSLFKDIGSLLVVFISFCLIASSIYIMNDIFDIEADKQHPEKRKRPIPSGKISVKKALMISATLGIAAFGVATTVSLSLLLIIGIYVLINIAYSTFLKKIPIMDITTVALGFVLRVIAGSKITGASSVYPSLWLILMTYLLAAFIIVGKRRGDIILLKKPSNSKYNVKFLDNVLLLLSGTLVVAYIQYTIDPQTIKHFDSPYVFFSIFFVLTGILRYLYIVFVMEESSNPTRVFLKDRFLQITIALWALFFVFVRGVK